MDFMMNPSGPINVSGVMILKKPKYNFLTCEHGRNDISLKSQPDLNSFRKKLDAIIGFRVTAPER